MSAVGDIVLAKPARPRRVSPLLLLLSLRTLIALFAVFAYFSLTAPNFLDVGTLVLLAKHVSINALLAIGMTFVVLTGGIDLSVGSIVGLTGMIAGALIDQGIPIHVFHVTLFPDVPEVVLIALLVGTLVGAVNGILITWLNVAPFIATLGTLYIARGCGAADVERRDVPQPRRAAAIPQHRLSRVRRRHRSRRPGRGHRPDRGGRDRDLRRRAHAVRPARVRGRRQRACGAAIRRSGRDRETRRLHDFGCVRRRRRP